jgi:hypothetical protein
MPLQAISGAASNVMHVCNTHLTFPSNLCRSPPRRARARAHASRTHARTRAHTHIFSTWGTSMKAQRRHNAHTDQTQTMKPVLLTTASMMELIAWKHAAVPHDAGVWRQSSLSSYLGVVPNNSPRSLYVAARNEWLYFRTIPSGQELCGMTRVTGH